MNNANEKVEKVDIEQTAEVKPEFRYTNVCKKYGISKEELSRAVEKYSKLAQGKYSGDMYCLLAIVELLCNGDIAPAQKKYGEDW